MKKFTQFFIILLSFLTLGAWNNEVFGGTYKTNLTVNIVGSGKYKLSASSTEPSSWSTTSSSLDNSGSNFWTAGNCTYHIWVQPSAGYRLSELKSTGTFSCTVTKESEGHYTVTCAGTAIKVSYTVTATFVADFYGKADSYADPSAGGKTYVSINGNWPNPSTDASQYKAHDESTRTAPAVTSAPKYTANFAAYLYDGYKFDGWYTATNKGGTKKSSNTTYSEEFTVNSTTSGSPTQITRYAHFSPVTVNSVDPAATSVTFTKPETKDVTLTFNVSNADAKADFNTPVISNTADWSLTSWSYVNNQVTVVVSMTVTGNVTVKGAHNTTVTLTSKGASDNQSKTATINATVNMDPMLTCDISNNYMVDEPALDLNALWTSSSNATKTYSIESFTPTGNNNEGATAPAINNNNMLSLGQAGTLVLSIHQPQTQSFNEKSDTKTISIDKRVTTSNGEDYIIKVNETKTANYGFTNTSAPSPSNNLTDDFYYTIDDPNFENAELNNGTELITYDPATNQITGHNAGTTKITFFQKETYKYTGATLMCNIAVEKRENQIANSWSNTWQKTMAENGSENISFTSTHGDYANYPISIEQIYGEDVAILTGDASGASITTNTTKGYAIWHLYQEENYEYGSAEADVMVMVGVPAPPTCYVYQDATEHKFTTSVWDAEGHFDAPIAITKFGIRQEGKRQALIISWYNIQRIMKKPGVRLVRRIWEPAMGTTRLLSPR